MGGAAEGCSRQDLTVGGRTASWSTVAAPHCGSQVAIPPPLHLPYLGMGYA